MIGINKQRILAKASSSHGATAVEHAVAIAIISLGLILATTALGSSIDRTFRGRDVNDEIYWSFHGGGTTINIPGAGGEEEEEETCYGIMQCANSNNGEPLNASH